MPRAVAACFLIGCAGNPANAPVLARIGSRPAGVRLLLNVTEYNVTSVSMVDLTREVARVGPEIGARRFAAVTHWRFRWRYSYDRRGVACELNRVSVDVETIVELPRRTASVPPDRDAVEWWPGFYDRLVEHEAGHIRLALETGAEIASELRAVSASGCEDAGFQAESRARMAMARGEIRQSAYDRATRHGALRSTPGASQLTRP